MKRSFFQAAIVSILLYGCTTWTLTKRMEKKLEDDYTRMLRAIRNKPWRQSSSYKATYHPSQKLSKLDETDTWTIGRCERRSGISVLVARHDDDDDIQCTIQKFLQATNIMSRTYKHSNVHTLIYVHMYIFACVYIYIYICVCVCVSVCLCVCVFCLPM